MFPFNLSGPQFILFYGAFFAVVLAALYLVRLLAGRQGDKTFTETLGRLRCERCGGRSAPIYLCAGHSRQHAGSAPPDWAIDLVRGPRQ